MKLLQLLEQARGCRVCERDLPAEPRPLLQGSSTSRLLIIGQAPGAAAHESGIPWHDRSGERLRDWLGISDSQFYDAKRVALMPMGFCYPGKRAAGDAPPRPECAPLWHPRLLDGFKRVKLTVYIGGYAFERYLSDRFESVTDAVRGFEQLMPSSVALPHPSPRNNIWLKKNGWFESLLVPRLRSRVADVIG